MRHIHRALLAAAHPCTALTTTPRRRRHTPCKGTKLTSDYVEASSAASPTLRASSSSSWNIVRQQRWRKPPSTPRPTAASTPARSAPAAGRSRGPELATPARPVGRRRPLRKDGRVRGGALSNGRRQGRARGRGDAQGDGLGDGLPPRRDGELLQLDKCGLDAQYELVVSADVLFGDLKGVLSALAAKTAPGGDLIFTVETLSEETGGGSSRPSRARPPGLRRGVATSLGLEAGRRSDSTAHGERPAGPQHAPSLPGPTR